ncbi:ribosomal protein S18 acetylase RimI-like enzyme [Isoptericola jiangsuensis]|uniref:Ribosomal protein S18 acetylase RimI-like enzyme n=1 Tax=Isoptericola jiangsuensis TaxID=548579 RepID=A0A2A9EZA3_9MICO|nr:N-acetyltransferase [Isoptericola jiangsuensis]PFG43871.1 ribosomal protein S18 acetylase RimI-like enzyme [Isoptericola jiangsuensis]
MPTAPDVVVRPARPDEAAEIAWLAALTFPLACPPGTATTTMADHVAARLTPAHFARWAVSDHHVLLVARPVREPRDVAGYALLVRGVPEGEEERDAVAASAGAGPSVELSKIYVHPARQGDGTAGALMSAAIDAAARLLPQGALWLGTNGLNARAQAFYRRHGFTAVGTRTYDVGGVQHDDVVMLHTA